MWTLIGGRGCYRLINWFFFSKFVHFLFTGTAGPFSYTMFLTLFDITWIRYQDMTENNSIQMKHYTMLLFLRFFIYIHCSLKFEGIWSIISSHLPFKDDNVWWALTDRVWIRYQCFCFFKLFFLFGFSAKVSCAFLV